MALAACGDDVETSADGGSGGNGSGGGVGLGGHCGSDLSQVECAGDCAFDATTIDCSVACTNLAAVCSEPNCSVQCDPQLNDMALCVSSCDSTKSQHCSNLAWGCYNAGNTCESAGACFFENKEQGL